MLKLKTVCNGGVPKLLGDDEKILSDKALETKIIKILMDKGLAQNIAKKMCTEFFYEEINKIAELPPVPDNYGDFLLENEATNENIRQMLAARWAIGVTEQEIRDWWNKSELERRLVRKCFEEDLKAAFVYFRGSGMSYEEAGEHVRKSMIVYGEIDFDVNLPYEWKDKLDKLLFEALATDTERVKAEAKPYLSVNDYIRDKIICKNNLVNRSPEHFN